MKKMFKYILIMIITLMCFNIEVRAADKGTKVCAYNLTNSNDKVYLYYKEKTFGDTISAYYNDEKVDFTHNYLDDDNIKKSICPKNIFKYKTKKDKVGYCVDDDGIDCLNRIDALGYKYVSDSGEIFNTCVGNGKCQLMCKYSGNEGVVAYLYYFPEKTINERYALSTNLNGFSPDEMLYLSFDGDQKTFKTLSLGKCPVNLQYFMKDTGGRPGKPEICVDTGDSSCSKQFNSTDYEELNYDMKSKELFTKNQKAKYLKSISNDEKYSLKCNDAEERIKKSFNINSIAEICGFNKVYKNASVTEPRQFFIVNTGTNFKYFYYTFNLSDNNNGNIKEIPLSQIKDDLFYNQKLTCTGYTSIFTNGLDNSPFSSEKSYSNMFLKTCEIKRSTGIIYEPFEDPKNCEDLIGEELIDEINSYLLYIKIAVPIIIIVMGSIDFFGAFIASDEEKMKKAQKKFIMRLIIGMVIFFVPILINALLRIANMVWGNIGSNTCGINFY